MPFSQKDKTSIKLFDIEEPDIESVAQTMTNTESKMAILKGEGI